MSFNLLFQALCKLKSSHSKTQGETEYQVDIIHAHNGRISDTCSLM